MGKIKSAVLLRDKNVLKKKRNKTVFKTQMRDVKGRFGTVKQRMLNSVSKVNHKDFKVATEKLSSIRSNNRENLGF